MSLVSRACSILLALIATLALSACFPAVGSERWCDNMREKPKGDWSINEAAEFTKHCLL